MLTCGYGDNFCFDGSENIRPFLYFQQVMNQIIQQQFKQKKRQMNSRIYWKQEQENLIKELRQVDKIGSWKKIAEILNKRFTGNGRTGKQCRDRYTNYIRFTEENPKLLSWTLQEDKILFEKIHRHGQKWVIISTEMLGRSENNLKNRFYGALRKIMRKITKVQKQIRPRSKKSIQERQLIKVFQQCRKISTDLKEARQVSQLYAKIIDLAVCQQAQISTHDVQELIIMLNASSNRIISIKTDPFPAQDATNDGQKSEKAKQESLLNESKMKTEDFKLEQNNNIALTKKQSRDSLQMLADFTFFQNDKDFDFAQNIDDPYFFSVEDQYF